MRILSVILLYIAAVGTVSAATVTLSHEGKTLNASLEQAADNWAEGPVVLMVHGTLAHRGMEIMATLQTLLAERGISSLSINLGLGLDDRAAAMYDCATPHTHLHTDAVAEIGAWLAWLKGQGATRVALLGHSRGGNQVARYALTGRDPVVSQLLLVAPQTWDADHGAQDYRERYGVALFPQLAIAEQMVADGRGADMMQNIGFIYCEDASVSAEAFLSYHAPDENMDTPHLLPQIRIPVTVYAGSEDTVIPDLVGKVEPLVDDQHISLEIIDGADHFFRDLYAEDVADSIAERLGGE